MAGQVELVESHVRSADGTPLSFWSLPGTRRLSHDGHRLTVAFTAGTSTHRLAWPVGPFDDARLAYAVPVGPESAKELRAVTELIAVLQRHSDDTDAVAMSPTRGSVIHMRALQALDAVEAGATQRDIAEVLFGFDLVARAWHADSDLRMQVRYLLRRGQHQMRSGYRLLVTGKNVKR